MRKRSFFITVVALFCLFLHTGTALALHMVAVKNNNVNLRSGPGTKKKVIWKLGKGFPLKVLKRSGKWLKVQDFEGTKGWIHKSVVNRSRHMVVKVFKNSKKQVNVRSGPRTKYKIVAKAHYGVVFKTLDQQRGWVKVRHGRITGWVKRSLLWGF